MLSRTGQGFTPGAAKPSLTLPPIQPMNRRIFLKTSAFTGTSLLLAPRVKAESAPADRRIESLPQHDLVANSLPNLEPAKWIWFPSGRTLQNTFVLFRRELRIASGLRRATGWIHADSRYRLELN